MLKVIHTSFVWLPQTQTWMFNQIRYLPEDIECYVLCERTANLDQFILPRMRILLQDAGIIRYYWEKGLIKLGFRSYSAFYASQAKTIQPNVIHSNFGPRGWLDLEIINRCKSRHITTFYGADVNQGPAQKPIWRKRYLELFSKCDFFLCEGSHMASCVERLGCPKDKIRVHHLGIEVGSIVFKPRTFTHSEPLKVLIAASFTEKKGIPYAIEALGKIRKDVPIVLTIIGDAKGGRAGLIEKGKVMEALEKTGLKGRTRLLGYQPHKRLFEEAHKHHLFLSPSVTAQGGDTEGGAPVSIIEMAATGIPVVSTMHCDIPEVLNYGQDGWLAEERDVDGLVSIIRKWLDETDKWPKLLAHARNHIETEYDAVKQGQRLGEIYQDLCS
jgi:colanic acid/amylovoran biosynthesis glycosyltransferase